MSSIFGRLKGTPVPSALQTGASPKKGVPQTPLTPLERLVEDAGPLRNDGNDKFFGMHNASNTCYCNSILQCLYYSEAFRQHVVSWPKSGQQQSGAEPDPTISQLPQNGIPTSPQTPGVERSDPFAPKKPGSMPNTPALPSAQQENKESFDYQKKIAMQAGPHLRMEKSFFDTYGMPESLFTGLKDLFEAVIAHQSRIGIITPAKFLEILRAKNEMFKSNLHQDAHEFMILVMNEMVEEVEKHEKGHLKDEGDKKGLGLSVSVVEVNEGTEEKEVPNWVNDIFKGTLTSETRCLSCENVSSRDEGFLDLSIDLDEHSSVTSCLRKFSEEEMLCERNKFHCDRCHGLQEAEKRMKIKKLPRNLALHLKRFKYVDESGGLNLRKLFHRVVYPFHLRILNTTDDVEDPDRVYELYAIVVHLGSTPYHGHYVSVIKTKHKGWLLFDDELVLPVDKDYVRNFFGGDPRNPACAYVLFYQVTTEEAVQREQEAEDEMPDIPAAAGFGSQGIMGLEPLTNTFANHVVTTDTIPSTPATEESDVFPNRLEHSATSPTPELSLPSTDETEDHESTGRRTSLDAESPKPAFKRSIGSLRKSGTNLNRFSKSNMSMSMKTKPKFWVRPRTRMQMRPMEATLTPVSMMSRNQVLRNRIVALCGVESEVEKGNLMRIPHTACKEPVFGEDGYGVEGEDADCRDYAALSLVPTVILLHLCCAPYTKVEESFNIQAIHDIFNYGASFSNTQAHLNKHYDHVSYPGAVPRTFVGALSVASLCWPFKGLLPRPEDYQLLARGLVGFANSVSLLLFQNAVSQSFGRIAGYWYILLQCSQFHIMYYASRTLPNMYAFALSTFAFRLLLLSNFGARARRARRTQMALYLLTIASVIFRSEVALLLAFQVLWLVGIRRVSLFRVIMPAGVAAMTIGLVTTVSVDSFFWQMFPIWPEWIAFRYNTIEGKSSDWGTSPWSFYFINAIPRLLLNPLCLFIYIPVALVDKLTRRFSISILAPLIGFVAVYSILPHKEWRFILYVIPSFTAVASAGAAYIWNRRYKNGLFGLLALTLIGSVLLSFIVSTSLLYVSSLNYPGAQALQRLHEIGNGQRPLIRVHLDNLACQTGITRFLQKPAPEIVKTGWEIQSVWYYDKTEDPERLLDPSFWDRFDYVIAEAPDYVLGKWEVVEEIHGFAGVGVVRGLPEENAQIGRKDRTPGTKSSSWEDYQQHIPDIATRLETLLRRYVTRGFWMRIKMEPKLRIMKKQET